MGYDVSWDKPHQPSDDPKWQESDCYWFFDHETGVGGFHRVGQTPNRGKGQVTLFLFQKDGQRFVRSHTYEPEDEFDLTSEARLEAKQQVGSHTVEALGEGRMRYTFEEERCSGDLEFYESFHEPRDWSKTGHSDKVMENINSDGHLECSGRLRGKVRLGDETIEIDALCHRDRSWGVRDNSRASLHRYRMFSGTVGPELSFASFLLDTVDGAKMVAGFVVRDGVDLDVRDLRVMITFDSDGITPLASIAELTLENDEVVKIRSECVQGFMTPLSIANCATQDHISTFEYQGKIGFLDLEFCANPGRGAYIPRQEDVTFTAVNQGLSSFQPYDW